MRRLVIAGAIALTAFLALAVWDYLKFSGRFLPAITPIEHANAIVVEKQKRQMTLLRDGTPIKTYTVALGGNPIGHKTQEGDGRTPEGSYKIDFKNLRSNYYLSLHISYPNETDRANAVEAGVDPGGDIMIHGAPNDGRTVEGDWTQGCIAVSNAEMDEIWNLVTDGTTIEINP